LRSPPHAAKPLCGSIASRDNRIMASALATRDSQGRRRRAPSIPGELRKEAAANAKAMGKKYRKLFNADRTLKERVARYITLLLPPRARRGRPRNMETTRAVSEYRKRRRQCPNERPRESWNFVAGKLIPDFGSHSELEQRALVDDLRTRAEKRLRLRTSRKPRRISDL
jgi:hypothetical protein